MNEMAKYLFFLKYALVGNLETRPQLFTHIIDVGAD